MILFMVTGQIPPILLLALGILIYLTVMDLWHEDDLPFLSKAWWVLLVFITNLLGYAGFRIWLATRRRGRQEA
jgi:hypothetical protein